MPRKRAPKRPFSIRTGLVVADQKVCHRPADSAQIVLSPCSVPAAVFDPPTSVPSFCSQAPYMRTVVRFDSE